MSAEEEPRQMQASDSGGALDEARSAESRPGSSSGALISFEQRERILVGPLPPPETLAKYEEISPGSADRIIAMAEKQAKHRQSLETQIVESNCVSQRRGPAYGFVILMTAMAIAAVLLWNGKDIAGLATLVSSLAAVVATFIAGKRLQRKKLEREQAEAEGESQAR